MKWTEVLITTTDQYEDIVTDILYEAGAEGLTIEDPQDILDMAEINKEWDFFQLDTLKMDTDQICFKAYFSQEEDIDSILAFIRQRLVNLTEDKEQPLAELLVKQVDDEDWAENWKEYYKTDRVGERIVIKPSWEEYDALEDDLVIDMDPGMAFGTGSHETTILSIQALEEFVEPGHKLYDIGTGSGILSIAAAKLGAEDVLAIDLDPMAVKVAESNIINNEVTGAVRALKGDLLDLLDSPADIIVSNIYAEVIVAMSPDLASFLKEDGIFIASGIILDKIDSVEEALLKNGFKDLSTRELNEWAAIVAKR